MTEKRYVLALDQGTTSSRSALFDRGGRLVAFSQQEFPQYFPSPDHVEHDPLEILNSQVGTAKEALRRAGARPDEVAAIGVTNQRETTLLWDRATGKPVAPATVWQSRITAPMCEKLRADGVEDLVRRKTGLLLDPYFSATKIRRLLDLDPSIRRRAERGEVLFGTVDAWLMWQLSGGKAHVTDVSNAARTLLMDLETLDWDDELLRIFGIPRAMLPEIRDSSEVYGTCNSEWFGAEIPLAAAAGDQQAALFGQTCFRPGDAKNTYGTGCFLLLNVGERPVHSQQRLLSTVAWRIGGRTTYCLEGAVFIAGAAVQWLRDELELIRSSDEIESHARRVEDNDGIHLVPAFVGLGAPYWDPYARGAILGLTRRSSKGHLCRAALEAMAFQTRDLLEAMGRDGAAPLRLLKVDGGATKNTLLMQFQADLLGIPVHRPKLAETTALGAAYLAGLAVGFWPDRDTLAALWELDETFLPTWTPEKRDDYYRGWLDAVRRVRSTT